MNNIFNNIQSFLEKYNLDSPSKVYLVGFSGGADSMCLLDALKKLRPDNKIIAVHLNHAWRGEESDAEEQNCKNFCSKINVEFYSEKLPENIEHNETAARTERYKFFERCADKYNSNIVFTAHNQNDNVETLIFRVCHGTGIKGLCGIAEKRGIYYRPLLHSSRREIEDCCLENSLKPNVDSSNFDTVHKRNLIRTEILPKLEEVCAGVQNSISSLCEIACEETEILKEYTEKTLKRISHGGKIKTDEYLKLSEPLQKRILYEIVTPYIQGDYDKKRILGIWDFIKENKHSKSGKTISITTNYWLFACEKYIEIISKKIKDNTFIKTDKTGEYIYDRFIIDISECNSIPEQSYGDGRSVIFVDLHSLNNSLKGLEFRRRRDGDIIQPLGMQGTQKLKKYLNSRKIPNHEKDNLLLLARGNEILWVAGVGLCDKIKVKTKPTHRIEIRERD